MVVRVEGDNDNLASLLNDICKDVTKYIATFATNDFEDALPEECATPPSVPATILPSASAELRVQHKVSSGQCPHYRSRYRTV